MDGFIQLIIGLIVLGFGGIGLVIYYESQRPSFELKKDDWHCTKTVTRTTLQLIGKTTVPTAKTYCVKYERIGD